MQSPKGLSIVGGITKYFEATTAKFDTNEKVVCSSDILESCFGKYKEVVKLNKTIGVSDICLSISCLTNNLNLKNQKGPWKA